MLNGTCFDSAPSVRGWGQSCSWTQGFSSRSHNLLQKDSEYLPCQITHTCKRHCFSYSWKRFSSWTVPSCTAGNVLIFTVLTNLRYYFPPFIVMFSKQLISATCLICRAQKWGEVKKENQLHPWIGYRHEIHEKCDDSWLLVMISSACGMTWLSWNFKGCASGFPSLFASELPPMD